MTQHQTTVSLSEWDRHAADWQARGWQIVSIATFRSQGQRRALVRLVKEDDR